jgi:hypothetical protein
MTDMTHDKSKMSDTRFEIYHFGPRRSDCYSVGYYLATRSNGHGFITCHGKRERLDFQMYLDPYCRLGFSSLSVPFLSFYTEYSVPDTSKSRPSRLSLSTRLFSNTVLPFLERLKPCQLSTLSSSQSQ